MTLESGRVAQRHRGLSKHTALVFGVMIEKGGIAPMVRSRRRGFLAQAEREEICRNLCAAQSQRQIARGPGRALSTISREVVRNGGRANYRALRDGRARTKAMRPKPCCPAINGDLRDLIAEKRQEQWSPQQISGWLEYAYSGEVAMQVSHETICKSLFIQPREGGA